MYIQTIQLSNYRGAESLLLNLHPRLNILVGCNGAGKSTVLDATALMLSWVISRIRQAGTSGKSLSEDDITNGKSTSTIYASVQADNNIMHLRLAKSRKGHGSPPQPSSFTELSEYTKMIQKAIVADSCNVQIPLFVHYPVNRAVLDIPLRIRDKHTFDLLTAYDDALTGGANFRRFFEWFREREDLENEQRKYQYQTNLWQSDQFCFPDPQLEAVRQAVAAILPDFENLTVRRSPLRMEVTKKGQILKVDQLSDGEKCLIALISDLARRLAIANPNHDPLQGRGIVLIDEIDLHLHPTWQRMIISQLVTVFPNCQFIVSTHSPHILTHVQPENIFLLAQTEHNITVTQPNTSYGKTVDRILEDVMGLDTTRPQPVSEALHQIYQLIDNHQLTKAQEAIATLKQAIHEDSELTKAEILIRRKEIIGR